LQTLKSELEGIDIVSLKSDVATVYASDFKTISNDWGEAIQAAIDSITNGTVLLPSGNLTYTTPIIQKSNIAIVGQGIYATVLKPVDCHGITIASDAYFRFASIKNLSIAGNNDGDNTTYSATKHGINWNSGTKETYQCTIRNVYVVNCYGKGIYIPFDFNNLLENVTVAGCGGNSIEMNGYITDTLINCLVGYVPTGKAGYRIYGRAHLIACNGLNGTGEYWGVFGRSAGAFQDADDGQVNQYYITFDNCNIEDFTIIGCKFIYGGGFEFRNTEILAPETGTFDYYLEVATVNKISTIDALTRMATKGATQNYTQMIKSNGGDTKIISLNPEITAFSSDNTNVIQMPYISMAYEYLQEVLNISYVNILGMSYYYLGKKKHTYGTAAPTTGTWAVGDTYHKTNPAEAGSAGSKYIITGWICTVAGEPGTWLEMRVLTGN
jgi:hypothetical protein